MTMLDFFAYRMHWRKAGVHPNNKFDPMFYARRLFQQYAVDAFSKVEENKLNWLRTKDGQRTLHADAYSRLNDSERVRQRRGWQASCPALHVCWKRPTHVAGVHGGYDHCE